MVKLSISSLQNKKPIWSTFSFPSRPFFFVNTQQRQQRQLVAYKSVSEAHHCWQCVFSWGWRPSAPSPTDCATAFKIGEWHPPHPILHSTAAFFKLIIFFHMSGHFIPFTGLGLVGLIRWNKSGLSFIPLFLHSVSQLLQRRAASWGMCWFGWKTRFTPIMFL